MFLPVGVMQKMFFDFSAFSSISITTFIKYILIFILYNSNIKHKNSFKQ